MVDLQKEFDYTDWNMGTSRGISQLDLNPPQNTYQNAGFTDIAYAQNHFDVTRYPIRTTVNIFRFVDDTLEHWNTGTLVAPNMVVTCAHSPYYYPEGFEDSLLIIPAYDYYNKDNPPYGKSISRSYYIPKTFYDNSKVRSDWDDIAIIELHEPIGIQTGWMGIAFHSEDRYCSGKVFHKFSYPRLDMETGRNYTGDTLFYNYGTLSYSSDIRIAYIGQSILGQSGSSLFFTDNEQYLVLGVGSHSPLNYYENGNFITIEGFFHYRIQRGMFYSLKPIIEKSITSIGKHTEVIPCDFVLMQNYPNPFNPSTTIRFTLPKSGHITLKIYNILGQEVAELINEIRSVGEHQMIWEPRGLASGVYVAKLRAGSRIQTRKLILQK
jgi:V8-like Glu-specific endopeptidase